MPELLEPQDIMFTPFEPKLKNRFIMQIDGINAYLIKTKVRSVSGGTQTETFTITEAKKFNKIKFL